MSSSSLSVSSSRSSRPLCAPSIERISSSSLIWIASTSRFCVSWMTKTIRNVTIVVAVLITSCQVSLNPKRGTPMIQPAILRRSCESEGMTRETCDPPRETVEG